ncbi:VOC family protein [Haladaptatus sp. NG-WS-4]
MLQSIDHVTVAGSAIDTLVDAFNSAGFATEYGGAHSNGTTHMFVVGFRDGSYIELISTLPEAEKASWWNTHIREDGGPCAWCLQVENLETVVQTLRDRGITVEGPTPFTRNRPDGVTVEWELAFPGEGEPGSTLPFLIEDHTPRDRRVSPTGSLADSPLVGVKRVILGIPNLDDAVSEFRTAFDHPIPYKDRVNADSVDFEANLGWFPESPVVLAEPNGGWLTERVEQFGASPCAFILSTRDLSEVVDSMPLTTAPTTIGGEDVYWISPTGTSIGFHRQNSTISGT